MITIQESLASLFTQGSNIRTDILLDILHYKIERENKSQTQTINIKKKTYSKDNSNR